ncbi:hexokinase-1-like [Oppia nitens]|uniref:hexokinase-1-like n=1 Tax=Oppia nitens TaxID=1686743 RepID=UPI0023DAD879|nr:hexokinase-1-like [Oppia nitens]
MDSSAESVLLADSPYHNPVLNIGDDSKKQKIREILKGFILSVSKVKKIVDVFSEEMRLGLEANPSRKSCFYMANTFVTDYPDGTEDCDVLAMDIGGSNLRVMLCRLKPGTEPEFRVQHYELTADQRSGTSAEQFFDQLAKNIGDFISKNPDISDKRLPLGFTFSFGYEQLALDKSKILQMGIQTNFPDAYGKCAVQFLRDAIARQGVNVDVISIANDVTTTLMYGMYLKPETYVSYILGSGMNAGYLEKVDRIGRIDPLKTFDKPVESIIVNTECGFLGDDGAIDYVKTRWDMELDEESMIPHSYGFEKLVGAFFFGDLIRRSLLTLAENQLFVGGLITDALKQKDSIKAPDASLVENDKSDDFVTKLLQRLGYTSAQITKDDIEIVKYVCSQIAVRNAQLIAANIASVVDRIDKPFIRVAIDGSFYKKHPKLHTLITDFIVELVPNNKKVELFLADDGSGKGSALIAAVAVKQRQKS